VKRGTEGIANRQIHMIDYGMRHLGRAQSIMEYFLILAVLTFATVTAFKMPTGPDRQTFIQRVMVATEELRDRAANTM
jgi:hypothetical protein